MSSIKRNNSSDSDDDHGETAALLAAAVAAARTTAAMTGHDNTQSAHYDRHAGGMTASTTKNSKQGSSSSFSDEYDDADYDEDARRPLLASNNNNNNSNNDSNATATKRPTNIVVDINNNSTATNITTTTGGGTAEPHITNRKRLKSFTAIDWGAQFERDRRKRIFKEPGIKGVLRRTFYSVQGWVTLAFIGIFCGIAAAVIEVGSSWTFDLRSGVCVPDFWLDRGTCCTGYDDSENCAPWHSWSQLFGLTNHYAIYWVNYALYVAIALLMAGTSAWWVKIYAPYAGGGGIPELKTILGGFVIPKFLGFRVLVIKVFGLFLSLGAGLILGIEGPMVHISCCIGHICSRIFAKYRRNEAKKRELLSACCATGISVAFGAPIGGVLFSLEETSSYFPPKTLWRSLFTAVVGVITLKVLNPNGLDLLRVSYAQNYHWFEIPAFLFIGIMGGIIGGIFIRVAIWVTRFRRRFSIVMNSPVMEVLLVAFVTAIISFQLPYMQMDSKNLLALMFEQQCDSPEKNAICSMEWKPLLLLFLSGLAKLVLLVFTFGLKVPSGMFVPSLCIGAIFGQLVGTLVLNLQQYVGPTGIFIECQSTDVCVIPGVYALIGAAVMMAGITRITVAIVVIMFEVTGGLEYLVPIMFSVLVAKWVGDAFGKESIYEQLIVVNNYPFLDNKIDIEVEGTASDMLNVDAKDLVIIAVSGNTLQSLQKMVDLYTFTGFPVVNNHQDRIIVGYIFTDALRKAIEALLNSQDKGVTMRSRVVFSKYLRPEPDTFDLSEYMDKNPIHVLEETPIDRIYDLFRALGLRYCLVERESRVVGVITKKDVLEFIHRLEHEHEHHPNGKPSLWHKLCCCFRTNRHHRHHGAASINDASHASSNNST